MVFNIRVTGHNSRIYRGKKSVLDVRGHLILGDKHKFGFGRTTILRMENNTKLKVDGIFRFYYGCDIQIKSGGILSLGSGFMNSDCKIRCKNSISIGQDVAISHDVLIIDFDGHMIDGNDDIGHPVIIGNHVWIGSKSIILKGVEIGENTVVGAGSVVTKSFPPNVIIAGNPAKIIRELSCWS